jgi:acid phosphatase family membrane protein YuiD
MILRDIVTNQVLICGLAGWWLAQLLKVPIHWLFTREWDLGLWFSSGGMPSSHSSLVVGTTVAIGLYVGFDSPLFAVAVALTMIVTYDASGVRRQAGFHAARINDMKQQFDLFTQHFNEFIDQFDDFIAGKPLIENQVLEERLKEVIGHTPAQVIGGTILGIVTSLVIWSLWH